MNLVVDTNVLLAAVMDEPEKPLITRRTLGALLLAPEILPYEVGNALTALHRRGRLTVDEVAAVHRATALVPLRLLPVDVAHAVRIALDAGICAYDVYFLVCALQRDCPLLTLDRRLQRVAKARGVHVLELDS